MGFPLASLLGSSFGSSAISGVSSILGGALGYAYNKKLMQAQQAYNTSERLATQQYNTSEREAAQAYNTGEREAQNAYAEQMYNTYSSPEALVRQYEEAGLNPRLAIGANSAGSVAASSGHSATVSPQSSGMLGMSPPYQDVTSFSQGFVNIANALKSLAEAKKSGVETKRLETFLQEELKGLQYQNRATELANLFNEKVLARADQKLDAEVKLILTQIANGELEGKELVQKIKYLESQNVIIKHEGDHWLEKFQAEQDIRKATKEELEAGAAEKRASAQVKRDEHDLFPEKRELYASQAQANRAQARLSRCEANLKDIDYQVKNFRGPKNFLNPEWRALSYYAKSQIESIEHNLEILGYDVEIKRNEKEKSGYEVVITQNESYISNSKADMGPSVHATGQIGGLITSLKSLIVDFGYAFGLD